MRFVFVILHYETIEDTRDLINSIENNLSGKYNIVIVDNGSMKNKANSYITEREDIKIIRSAENLGFAKGMNLGIKYAKEKLRADFIILLNNDLIIKDKKFIKSVKKKYEEYNYYIMGPKIISLVDRKNQNPVLRHKLNFTISNGLYEFFKYLFKYILTIIKMKDVVFKAKDFFMKKQIKKNQLDYEKDLINLPLQGSCIILSPNFINNYKGLYDKTFLYGEELILYYQMSRDSNLILYSPQTCVYHKEGSATDYTIKEHKKEKFILKNMTKSRFEFVKLLLKDKLIKK